MLLIAKWIIIGFAAFFIFAGMVMLFVPKYARQTLRKAGSTNFINYAEITLRMIPAAALILYADFSKFPLGFKIFGWMMILTSLILYFVPRQVHHRFSMKAADKLKERYFQFVAPFAFLAGSFIIYCIV